MQLPADMARLADGRRVHRTTPAGILALSLQPDAEARLREILGPAVGWLSYTAPGTDLRRALDELAEKDAATEAVVVQWVGLLVLGDSDDACAARSADLAARASAALEEELGGRRMLDARPVVAMRDVDEVAHLLRGALAVPTGRLEDPYHHWVLEYRSSEEIAHYASAEIASALVEAGPVVVDHAPLLRGTLLVQAPPYASLDALASRLREEVETRRRAYLAYADRCPGAELGPLDPTPRVVLLPGLGVFGVGTTRAQARRVADLAELNIRAQIQAIGLGGFAPPPEEVRAPVELAGATPVEPAGALAGQALLLAGAARSAAAAGELAAAGAAVLATDADPGSLAPLVGTEVETFECELIDDLDARDAVRRATTLFGGLDAAVLDAEVLGHDAVRDLLDEALHLLGGQGTGGTLLVVGGDAAVAALCERAARDAADARVRVCHAPGASPERIAMLALDALTDATGEPGAVVSIDAA